MSHFPFPLRLPTSIIPANIKPQILYYDDTTVVKAMQSSFPAYASKFPEWAQESTAMHQYAIWCALEAEGLGANLQHYNPIIDVKVAAQWHVPESWVLRAQMVIGNPIAPAGEKQFKPVEERFLVYGA
jgi:predicted oxidoreductase (fatty acid repression mutant protein)